MQNFMALFIFSALDGKHLFFANLVQNIRSLSLSWNYAPRLIRICRIQWYCSRFLFPKIQSCQFKLKFGTRLIRICRVQWWCSLSLFYTIVNKEQLLSLQLYRSRDFEIGCCREHGFFILLWWVHPWIVFVHCLKIFLKI